MKITVNNQPTFTLSDLTVEEMSVLYAALTAVSGESAYALGQALYAAMGDADINYEEHIGDLMVCSGPLVPYKDL